MRAPVDYPIDDSAHDVIYTGDELIHAVLLDRLSESAQSARPDPSQAAFKRSIEDNRQLSSPAQAAPTSFPAAEAISAFKRATKGFIPAAHKKAPLATVAPKALGSLAQNLIARDAKATRTNSNSMLSRLTRQ